MDLIGKCGVEVTIGLVQTAYANGASTDYIQNVLVSKSSSRPTLIIMVFQFVYLYTLESTSSYHIYGC